MADIIPVSMQSLSAKMGEELAIRSCAPIAFYMLLKANGYLPSDLEPDEYMVDLDRAALTTGNGDWSRPALTHYLRHRYSAPITSWWINGEIMLDRMVKAGYVESPEEIQFLEEEVKGKRLSEIVQAGYPVIVTMRPGFGGTSSKDIHAVIVLKWGNQVTVVDPDARNSRTEYRPEDILGHILPNGAGSVILPRDDE